MPKATSDDIESEDMLATIATTTKHKTSHTVTKASTLSEMWLKKPSMSTSVKAKASTMKPTADAKGEPEANSSKARTTAAAEVALQENAVTQGILDTLETDTMGESWLEALKPEFKKPYFTQLKKFLAAENASQAIYPPAGNIYSWSRLTPLDQVKVVILGQDPYHNQGQAHGLSFSVLPPTKPPGSLKNIYKQLETDIPTFKAPQFGDLSPIAKQGVLWLNTSLTVRAHKAGSHSRKGWETFTAQVIRAILQREGEDSGVVFMAWGLPAQKTLASIGINKKKHLYLESAHPSPLSAHRGFLGNGHFRKANEWLAQKYGKEAAIDWTVISAK
ncbi:hypothetical protein NLJ89_g3158 [Agrocybe chaxingu]|uniref:Uracil-DNA glycosylase n=1 Tax=Agrocybe chaxingu TaxID=84603 RepID=A0A9W8K4J0_9AGAR|nr:hypothetical protein NLJ89_g3158 [Agrocybe chaxingu]